jgi:chromosome partitioning protein
MQARIITVANQKGGVGKTTTAVSLAAELAGRFRVLLIDLDPQANATSSLGQSDPERTLSTYDVLLEEASLNQVVIPGGIAGLDLAPADRGLAGAQIELVGMSEREHRLARAIRPILAPADPEAVPAYDLVFIDTPPSLGLLTLNALAASDHVLVPVQSEYLALEGLGQLVETLELVRSSLNPKLGLIGILLTMADALTRLSEQVTTEVRHHFTAATFRTAFPRSVRLSEAPSHGRAIKQYDPSSRGARAYAELANELLSRLGMTGESAPSRRAQAVPAVDDALAAGAEAASPVELAPADRPAPPDLPIVSASIPSDLRDPADRPTISARTFPATAQEVQP